MPPTLANGKVCYIEFPAVDIQRAAKFYTDVFGWQTHAPYGASWADEGVRRPRTTTGTPIDHYTSSA